MPHVSKWQTLDTKIISIETEEVGQQISSKQQPI